MRTVCVFCFVRILLSTQSGFRFLLLLRPGIDTVNACYGGTAALHNAVNWVESSSWDGRYAMVVTGDIAVYEPGPARPTGGAGVVAMLIGPKAPISFERGVRGSYMEHAYDFYKPNLSSEYPVVDGHLSITCYLRALDSCYGIYSKRFEQQHGRPFDLGETDYALFHSPFTKMVRKSYARMKYLDYLQKPESFGDAVPREVLDLTAEQSYTDRVSQKIFGDMTKEEYDQKVGPSLLLPKQLGNTYTASLYTSLLSLIAERSDEQLLDKRLLMFSYGSGLAATQWSFKVNSSVEHIRANSDIKARLAARTVTSPEDYTAALKLREDTHNLASYSPQSSVDHLPKGTYYLENVDDKKRRFYARAE
jgi:hydroxymethylglutaryl-CoA synthase